MCLGYTMRQSHYFQLYFLHKISYPFYAAIFRVGDFFWLIITTNVQVFIEKRGRLKSPSSFNQFRHNVESIAYNSVISGFEERGFRIFIDNYDHLTSVYTCQMLYGS